MPSPRSQQRATKYLSHSRSLGSSGSKSSSSSCRSIVPSALPGYSMLASSHSSPSSWSKNSSSFALIIVEFICGGGEKLALAEKRYNKRILIKMIFTFPCLDRQQIQRQSLNQKLKEQQLLERTRQKQSRESEGCCRRPLRNPS